MKVTPNEIAGLIYWSGDFGPNFGFKATDNNGTIVNQIPAPGTPERTKVENWLDTAIAICLAESGGDTTVVNQSSGASGLWQILVSVHKKEINDALVYWETNLANGKNLTILDQRVNTYTAGLVWQSQGFKAWEAYNNGNYKKFLGHGKAAYAYLTSPDNLKQMRKNLQDNLKNDKAFEQYGGFLAGGFLGNVNLPSWMDSLLSFLRSGAVAVGLFLLAVVLLLVGAWILISHSKSGQQAIKVASKLPI